MKAFCLYLLMGLTAIVAQTTVLRLPMFHNVISDFLIPFVVFMSLDRPDRQGAAVSLILGLVMDMISGGVFGLYISVYLWVFVSARGLSRYFDVGETAFQAILIGLYVLCQQLVFLAFVAPSWQDTPLLVARATPILSRALFGALTGPVILMLLRRFQRTLDIRSSMVRREAGELGG